MAVPLEKFSEMLEEAGQKKSGGSSDVFNKDKSSKLYREILSKFYPFSHFFENFIRLFWFYFFIGQKQLKWEASRIKQRWRSKPKLKENNAKRQTHMHGSSFKGAGRINHRKKK